MTTTDIDAVQNQLCTRIEELEAEKLALLEENARLADELRDRYCQTRCGCGHPACKRCRDDRDTEAVLYRIMANTPETGLARRDARMKAEALMDYAQKLGGLEQELAEIESGKYRRQAEGD